MAVTDWKLKDRFTGTLVRVSTTEQLDEWLRSRYATLMPDQERCIIRLCETLDADEDPKWWADACDIIATRQPGRKRK